MINRPILIRVIAFILSIYVFNALPMAAQTITYINDLVVNNEASVGVNTITGENAVAIGSSNEVESDYALAVGQLNKILDYQVNGDWVEAEGAFANGLNNTVRGKYSFSSGWSNTTAGAHSASFGIVSRAMGTGTFASGFFTDAFGNYSTAIGWKNNAYGHSSHARGVLTNTHGSWSFGYGNNLEVDAYASFMIGQWNDIIAGETKGQWIDSDSLFVVANGKSETELSNALVMKKTGDTTLKGDLRIKKSDLYVDENGASTGGDVLVEGNLLVNSLSIGDESTSTSLSQMMDEKLSVNSQGVIVGDLKMDPSNTIYANNLYGSDGPKVTATGDFDVEGTLTVAGNSVSITVDSIVGYNSLNPGVVNLRASASDHGYSNSNLLGIDASKYLNRNNGEVPPRLTVKALGYYMPSDAGGGTFYFDPSNADVVDNVVTFEAYNGPYTDIETPPQRIGTWRRVHDGFITPDMAGAVRAHHAWTSGVYSDYDVNPYLYHDYGDPAILDSREAVQNALDAVVANSDISTLKGAGGSMFYMIKSTDPELNIENTRMPVPGYDEAYDSGETVGIRIRGILNPSSLIRGGVGPIALDSVNLAAGTEMDFLIAGRSLTRSNVIKCNFYGGPIHTQRLVGTAFAILGNLNDTKDSIVDVGRTDGNAQYTSFKDCEFWYVKDTGLYLEEFIVGQIDGCQAAYAETGFHISRATSTNVMNSYAARIGNVGYYFDHFTYSNLSACAADRVQGTAYYFKEALGVTFQGGTEQSQRILRVDRAQAFHMKSGRFTDPGFWGLDDSQIGDEINPNDDESWIIRFGADYDGHPNHAYTSDSESHQRFHELFDTPVVTMDEQYIYLVTDVIKDIEDIENRTIQLEVGKKGSGYASSGTAVPAISSGGTGLFVNYVGDGNGGIESVTIVKNPNQGTANAGGYALEQAAGYRFSEDPQYQEEIFIVEGNNKSASFKLDASYFEEGGPMAIDDGQGELIKPWVWVDSVTVKYLGEKITDDKVHIKDIPENGTNVVSNPGNFLRFLAVGKNDNLVLSNDLQTEGTVFGNAVSASTVIGTNLYTNNIKNNAGADVITIDDTDIEVSGVIKTGEGIEFADGSSQLTSYLSQISNNLVTNGLGYQQSNLNFSKFEFDGSVANKGRGSFKWITSGGPKSIELDEFIPVDVSKSYQMKISSRTDQAGLDNGVRVTLGYVAYDIDYKQISAYNHMRVGGSDTVLAQDFTPGETEMFVADVTGWSDATLQPVYTRLITIWNDKSEAGFDYGINSYSRNTRLQHYYDTIAETGVVTDYEMWEHGAVDTVAGKITLKSASAFPLEMGNPDHPSGTWPAGTPISRGSSGGTNRYNITPDALLNTEWAEFSSIVDDVDYTGTNNGLKFPPGTSFIRLLCYEDNRGSAAGHPFWLADLSVVEVQDSTIGDLHIPGDLTVDGNINLTGDLTVGGSVTIPVQGNIPMMSY